MPSDRHADVVNRRNFLGSVAAIVTAGCLGGGPKTFTATLESKGVDVEDVEEMGRGTSLLYYRDAERHQEQLRAIALAFAENRDVVPEGGILAFTGLSDPHIRHGVGFARRVLADRFATGELEKQEYVQEVSATYEPV